MRHCFDAEFFHDRLPACFAKRPEPPGIRQQLPQRAFEIIRDHSAAGCFDQLGERTGIGLYHRHARTGNNVNDFHISDFRFPIDDLNAEVLS